MLSRQAPLQLSRFGLHRLYHVVSWGRNSEGQSGVENATIVTRPTPILGIGNAVSVSAGRTTSGVITAEGNALTLGDGKSGKTGHGSSNENTLHPTVVETLASRARVTSIALGDHHTLFLDDKGSVWASGDNKLGQCGLGTPLGVIAQQHRQALIQALLHGNPGSQAQQEEPAMHLPAGRAHSSQISSSSGRSRASDGSAVSNKSGERGENNSRKESVSEGSNSSERSASSSSSSSSSDKSVSSNKSSSNEGDISSRVLNLSGPLHSKDGVGLKSGGSYWGSRRGTGPASSSGSSSSSGGSSDRDDNRSDLNGTREGAMWHASDEGGGRKGGGRASVASSRSGAGEERERWVERTSSRIYHALQQRFQEMQQQHRQEVQRYRTRTLPVHPRQQDMHHHADALGHLVQQSMPTWRHNSGPAHITLGSSTGYGPSSAAPLDVLGMGENDLIGHCRVAGLQEGIQCTPTRVGRDQHALAAQHHRSLEQDVLGTPLTAVQSGGIPEAVTSVAASSKFSVAVSESGNVWTWGHDADGALGIPGAWSTSPQKVGGPLASVLADNGGAAQVAAGSSFCVAITRNGKAVVWGRVPGGRANRAQLPMPGPTNSLLKSLVIDHGGSSNSAGRVDCGEVPLRNLTMVACGAEHALLSDGQRVWVIGRTVDSEGSQVVQSPWDAPVLVHDAGRDEVRSVSAGLSSSAIVTRSGNLLLWGKLIDKQTSSLLIYREHALQELRSSSKLRSLPPPKPSAKGKSLFASPLEALGGPRLQLAEVNEQQQQQVDDTSTSFGAGARGHLHSDRDANSELARVQWDSPVFGAAHPTLVEELEGRVKGVALGGWHALALVE